MRFLERRPTPVRVALAAGLLLFVALALGACEPIVPSQAPGASSPPAASVAPGESPGPATTPTPNAAPSATPAPTPLIVSPAPLKADPISILAALFNPVFQAFLILLVGIHHLSGLDVGIAIIVTTLIVRTGLVPLAFITYTSRSPSRSLVNAIRVPSGDQAGSPSKAGETVSRRSTLPSVLIA